MIFDYYNQQKIDDQYIHDSDFEGFSYDNGRGRVTTICVNRFEKIKNTLIFHEVFGVETQACKFWGGGNSVCDIWIGEGTLIRKLLEDFSHNSNGSWYDPSEELKQCIEVCLQVNSGDMLTIVCKQLEWVKEEIEP